MAQSVTVLATKLDSQSVIPMPNMVEGEKRLLQVVL